MVIGIGSKLGFIEIVVFGIGKCGFSLWKCLLFLLGYLDVFLVRMFVLFNFLVIGNGIFMVGIIVVEGMLSRLLWGKKLWFFVFGGSFGFSVLKFYCC